MHNKLGSAEINFSSLIEPLKFFFPLHPFHGRNILICCSRNVKWSEKTTVKPVTIHRPYPLFQPILRNAAVRKTQIDSEVVVNLVRERARARGGTS